MFTCVLYSLHYGMQAIIHTRQVYE